ncbi:hypothetical protein R5R35_009724 [Gryllus longicercus]|uniref:Vitellogenin n=1 Tax=Gryllus longicercus TaxID=2509291 RepID=A0AAN9ZFH6_9ORTH
MMFKLGFLIWISAIFAGSNGLFLKNSEILYQYNAIVKAGTLTPLHGSSDWALKGTLRLQVHSPDVILQFKDLTVSLFNGKHDKSPPELTYLPIPEEANELLKPFVIHYDEGKIKNISVEANEPIWSVNMKRALASIFQLEEAALQIPSFISKETSLYGNCDVEYTVTNVSNEIIVRKFIDHLTCENYPRLIWKNTSPLLCPSGRSIVTSTSGRLYVLVPTEGVLTLKHVEVHSGVDVQPFHAHGELNYAFVNQSISMSSRGSITENISLQNNIVQVDLLYELPRQDLTQGRAPYNDEEHLKMVDTYLKRIIDTLEVDSSLNEIKSAHNEYIPHLLHFLSLISRPQLEQYYNELAIGTSYHQETQRNLFLKLLPQVGSNDAILLIQDLVRTGKEKGKIAIELLTVLPFYIRHPSEDLLKLSEKLLSLGDDIIEEVKQSAILTFSIMVHKVCKTNCRPETLEKYVRLFIDKFSNSRSYSEQVLYLEVLNNIELGNVFDYLVPIIKGKVSVFTEKPHHIRFLGVWASMSQAVFNPHKVGELYWPILANRSEHLEMRVAALTMLILAKPTHSNFVNLLWFMQSEHNAHLLHFYYTTLESLIETQYPCYTGLGTLASHIIRYVRPPAIRNWATGNYILDYSDPKHGFGGLAQLFAVANQRTGNPNVFYLLANSHALDHNLRQFAIYLKLEGVSDAIKDMLFKTDKSVKFSDLINIFQEIKAPIITSEPIHIEIIAKIEDRVVYCQYINKTNFYKLAEVVSKMNFLEQEVSINYQTVKAPVLIETTQPTDIGVPLLMRTESSVITSIRGNFTKDGSSSVLSRKNEVDIRYIFTSGSNLIIYNPILNLWHAARRAVSYQSYFPIVNQVSVHPKQREVKLILSNPAGVVRGFVAHSQSTVNIYGKGSKKISQFCPKCKNSVVVTAHGKKHVHDIINISLDDIGTKVQISLYDCDHSYALNDLITLVQDIFSENNKNFRVFPISRPFLGLIHSVDLLSLVPPKGSCGLRFNVSSTSVESTELILTGALSNLGKKQIFKISIDLKSSASETSLKSWDVALNYNVQNENTKYNLQMNITRASEAQAFQKVCFDQETLFPKSTNGLLPWKPSDDVTTKVNIVWGKSNESCPKDGGEVHVVAHGEVTKEQKDLLNNSKSWPHAACLVDSKNTAEWGQGYTPITEACYRASVEVATLRQYTASLAFINVPQSFLLISKRIIAVMDALTPGLMSLPLNELSNLTVSLKVPLNKPHISLNVNSRKLVLPKAASWFEPFLINTCVDMLVPQAMRFGALGSCVVNSARVISIDNKTHSFSASPCYTLVAGDCTPHPHFAVFVRRISESKPLAAKLHLNGNVIEILPVSNGELKIFVNNENIAANESESQEKQDFRIQQLEKGLVRVTSDTAYIWLQHNGYFLTLVVPAFYRGQLCGLCGDFNGDASNDDIGAILKTQC